MPKERCRLSIVSLSTVKTSYVGELRGAGVEVALIPQRGAWSWGTFLALRRVLRAQRPDLVHTWLFTADLYGRLAALAAGVPRIVCAIRNTIDDMPWHHRIVNRALARWTSRITVNAAAIIPGLVRTLGVPEERIIVIPNGIDLAAFPAVWSPSGKPEAPLRRPSTSLGTTPRPVVGDIPSDPEQGRGGVEGSVNGAYRSEWRVPSEGRIVAMVARFAPQKDHRTFLEAARLVAAEAPEACFVLVGDGPLRADIERRADELGLTPRTRLAGPRRDVWALLHHVDVCVLSSLYEGSSNVILEAMAASRPVVATDVGGNRELIADGETGRLVPKRDPVTLARAILDVLRDPARAQAMGAAARRRVEAQFSLQATVQRTEALYRSLLEQKSARHFFGDSDVAESES
jgi:glycosyltransferase involved in cell wall biosynthesis